MKVEDVCVCDLVHEGFTWEARGVVEFDAWRIVGGCEDEEIDSTARGDF